MNRRTLIKSAAWGVPAVTLAAASPAFATSDDHECHPVNCKPRVKRRKCTPDEKKKHGKPFAYEAERTCPWSHVQSAPNYGGWVPNGHAFTVVWSPNTKRGQKRTYRTDAVSYKKRGK